MLAFVEHEVKDISVPVYDNPDAASLSGKSMGTK